MTIQGFSRFYKVNMFFTKCKHLVSRQGVVLATLQGLKLLNNSPSLFNSFEKKGLNGSAPKHLLLLLITLQKMCCSSSLSCFPVKISKIFLNQNTFTWEIKMTTSLVSWEIHKKLIEFMIKTRKNMCHWAQKNVLNSNGKQVFIPYWHLLCININSITSINSILVQFLRKQDLYLHFASQKCILI